MCDGCRPELLQERCCGVVRINREEMAFWHRLRLARTMPDVELPEKRKLNDDRSAAK